MFYGYTQDELAQLLQVSQANVSKLLSGRHQARRSTIIRLAKVTGQTYSDIVEYFYNIYRYEKGDTR